MRKWTDRQWGGFAAIFTIIALAGLWLWALTPKAHGVDFGPVQTTTPLLFPINSVDTLGRPFLPDSFHIHTWHQSQAGGTPSYSARGAHGASRPAWIGANAYASAGSNDSDYVFFDDVADIDNNEGIGLYTGVVYTWSQGEKFPTAFSFRLMDSSLDNVHNRIAIELPNSGGLKEAFDNDDTYTTGGFEAQIDRWGDSLGDALNRTMTALPNAVPASSGGLTTAGAAYDGLTVISGAAAADVYALDGDAGSLDSLRAIIDSLTRFANSGWEHRVALASDSGNAGTGLDSATTSRIIGRKVWGLESSGSDSSTIAQRTVLVDSVQAHAINANAIAADAIGASELAANAIGASELATDAIDKMFEYDATNATGTSSVGTILLQAWAASHSPVQRFNLVANGGFDNTNVFSTTSFTGNYPASPSTSHQENWYCDSCGTATAQITTAADRTGRKGWAWVSGDDRSGMVHSEDFYLTSGVTYLFGGTVDHEKGAPTWDTMFVGDTSGNRIASIGIPYSDSGVWEGSSLFRPFVGKFSATTSQPARLYMYNRRPTQTPDPVYSYDDIFVIPFLDSAGIDAITATTTVAGIADTLRDVIGDTFNVISGGVLLAARGSDADTGIAGIKTKLTTIAGDVVNLDGGTLPWNATSMDSVLQALDYTNNTHEVVRQVASTVATVTTVTNSSPDSTRAVLALEISDTVWNEDSTGHYTTPNMAFVASQTAAGAADPWSAATVDSVLQALDYTNNTNAVARTDDLSAIGCAGSGAKPVTLMALDTSGTDSPIPWQAMTVSTLAGTVIGTQNTSAAGTTDWNLDASTSYVISTGGIGYIWRAYDTTTTTSGGGAFYDTTKGYDVAPTNLTPGSQKTTLYDWCVLGSDTLKYATVRITMGGGSTLFTTTEIVPSVSINVKADANGYWEKAIFGTDSVFCAPGSTNCLTYTVEYIHSLISQSGTQVRYEGLSIPADGATTRLRDVLADQ